MNEEVEKTKNEKNKGVYTCSNCPHAGNLMFCHNCINY